MAGVESSAAPPQAPPPPPPREAAPAPAGRLADCVVVFVVFGFFGFAWMSSAANAAFIAAEWGYGAGSIEEASAKEIALAASVLLGVFLHAVVLVILGMCWRHESRRSETREVGGGGGTAAQPVRVYQDPVPGAVIVSLVVVFMIVALGVLMLEESWAKRAGYLLLETVFFLGFIVYCFVTCPLLIIRIFVASCAERRETTGSH
ncbi:hypothetical protein PAHAL_6G198700 [Panicum hallii]|uniref:Uncharacterized protein n=1 Tax=Panicum hallii TaxID=206008 RepID=A0A2S3I2F7_9POAL|nr:uncharacterized protein LOC112897735 [Panicum hallii]PAN35316.1 hypothetical protein PAHAL_6G198700 [Panicum hallii]